MESINGTIRVSIKFSELCSLHEQELQATICTRLRGAGVPVLGMWGHKGVAHGKLMCYDDDLAQERVYLWRDKA